MSKYNINSKQGFTIIEVVLVLAIAGLIFLMVFIALPNLQRSQRDTQRRNDYAALAANITGYITNNNGKLPAAGATLDVKKYINQDGADGAGKTYILKVVDCGVTSGQCNLANATGVVSSKTMIEMVQNAQPNVYIVLKAQCGDVQGQAKASAGLRDFTILGQLESGVYCQDNV